MKCEICGKEFLSANHLKIHNISPREYYVKYINSRTKCSNSNCNNYVRFISFSRGFSKYCSNKCAAHDRDEKQRNQKIKKNNLKKYGTEYYFQSDVGKQKIKESNLNKYGVDNPQKNKHIQEKTKKTILKKYGVDNYVKINITNRNLLNKQYILNNFLIDGIYLNKEKLCEFYNISIATFYNLIKKLKIKNPVYVVKNKKQQEIYNFCNTTTKVLNDRTILNTKELDIYFPDNNLAIEFDGLLFHSYGKSKYKMFDNYNDENKYYHLNKTKECDNKNINLLHIFENEWDNEVLKNIWKSVINYKLGIVENKIFARRTVVKEINYNIDEFLINNHLQGKCSSSVKIGLFYNEELVSVMTFGKSRFNKNVEWELLRYCNIINTQIIGGASKLFNYFLNKYNPKSIISYANRRWSTGNLYEKLNFEFDSITEPNYFYFKENDNVLYSRIKFQKHKLNNILENFDDSLSETINMYNNGYRKIYDCGNLRYIWYKQ